MKCKLYYFRYLSSNHLYFVCFCSSYSVLPKVDFACRPTIKSNEMIEMWRPLLAIREAYYLHTIAFFKRLGSWRIHKEIKIYECVYNQQDCM